MKVHHHIHKSVQPVPIINPIHTSLSYFLKIHVNTMLSMPRSSKWSLSLRFPHQNPICTSPPTHKHARACAHTHTHTHTHHAILLDLITWTETDHEGPYYVSPTFPCYLVFRPKYLPQRPILKHPQPTFLPECERPSFTPTWNKRKTTSLCILSFIFWIANGKTEFLDWMVAGIPWVRFALNFFTNAVLIVMVVAKSLNFATHSKIYYLSLRCDFFPHSVHEPWPHT